MVKILKRILKKNQQYINHVQVFLSLEKSYLSYMVSNGDTLYMEVVALAIGQIVVNCYALGTMGQYFISLRSLSY
jgi:hypothetical protein